MKCLVMWMFLLGVFVPSASALSIASVSGYDSFTASINEAAYTIAITATLSSDVGLFDISLTEADDDNQVWDITQVLTNSSGNNIVTIETEYLVDYAPTAGN